MKQDIPFNNILDASSCKGDAHHTGMKKKKKKKSKSKRGSKVSSSY